MKVLTPLRFLCATTALVLASCSSGSSSNDGLLFRGEGKLLEGFAFDTGPQPAAGPVSITLRLSGGGAVNVEARGAIDGGRLRGTTGRVDIDAHVKLDGTLRIDSTIKKSTGDIPGLKDLDVAIKGSVEFEPFLLGRESAEVVAAIPETKLPDVPLGSVPGKLRLTIAAGSQLISKYAGTCMTVASGVAQYEGHAITSGTLKLKGTLVLELPAPLDKEVTLPEIVVAIPSATSNVAFSTVAASGAEDGATSHADSGVDSAKNDDTGSPSDSAAAETARTCSGDGHEPDSLRDDARLLPVIRDCDGDEATVTGMLSSNADVDVLRFIGEDTFGCAVNAYAKVTGPARICLAPVCTVGETNFQGCAKGAREGDECCGTEVEADFNCAGTTKDNARVYLTVRPSESIAVCSTYSIRYHY